MDDRFHFRRSGLILLVLVAYGLGVPGFAQTAKVERTGPVEVTLVPPQVAAALEEKGYRVTLNDGWSAELWLARELKVTNKDKAGALYPGLSDGEFICIVSLPKGMSDFRGQAIAAGAYTLRYQYLPQDANHMGVSPNPDFLLAIPAATYADPSTNYPFRKLVSLSGKTTGAHPAVIAMDTAGEPGSAVFTETKMLVFTVKVKSVPADQLQRLGIVLRGQATQ